jgi:hypothetical protein
MSTRDGREGADGGGDRVGRHDPIDVHNPGDRCTQRRQHQAVDADRDDTDGQQHQFGCRAQRDERNEHDQARAQQVGREQDLPPPPPVDEHPGEWAEQAVRQQQGRKGRGDRLRVGLALRGEQRV